MDWINKFGQRNIAKYLIFVSIFVALTIYAMKFLGVNNSSQPSFFAVLIGTVIFSLPNMVIYLIANKTREYRLLCLHFSMLVIILNGLLFILSIYSPPQSILLFILSVLEVIITTACLFYVNKIEKNKNKLKSRDTNTNTKTKTII